MDIKSLADVDFTTIFEAFGRAFADYEMQVNKKEFETMLKRRGFNAQLSFAAFDNHKIVAFTLNGIGNFNGIPTAYDTGTGTLKEYRGQGLATQIFEYSIPYFKKAGIQQYLLEVLQHNTKAVSVYRNLGFQVSREFNYFIQKNEAIKNELKAAETAYSVKPITIEEIDAVSNFCDFYPSWQNSTQSIKRSINDFVILGAFVENKLVGYCIFEPTSGDVTQIAVDIQHRRKGIATALFGEITKLNQHAAIKIVNTPVLCHSITHFLKTKNIDITGTQFEMTKSVSGELKIEN